MRRRGKGERKDHGSLPGEATAVVRGHVMGFEEIGGELDVIGEVELLDDLHWPKASC